MNIKGVDAEFVGHCKVAAFRDGNTLKKWVVRVLRGVLEEKYGLRGKVAADNSKESMPSVRGGVRKDSGDKRRGRKDGATAVLGSHDNPPADSGAVGEGIRQDTEVSVTERKFLGPPHSKTCQCKQCKEKKNA